MPPAHIEKAFEMWWPVLEKKLQSLPPDEPTKSPHRGDRELLTELVVVTRQTSLSVLESHERVMEELSRLKSEISPRGLSSLREMLVTPEEGPPGTRVPTNSRNLNAPAARIEAIEAIKETNESKKK